MQSISPLEVLNIAHKGFRATLGVLGLGIGGCSIKPAILVALILAAFFLPTTSDVVSAQTLSQWRLPMRGNVTVTGNLPPPPGGTGEGEGDHRSRDRYAVDLVSDNRAVYSVTSGTVVYSNYNCEVANPSIQLTCYGYTVAVDHGGGVYSIYTHLAGVGTVAQWSRVDSQTQIGTMSDSGCNGHCSAHLHFAVHRGKTGLIDRLALFDQSLSWVNVWDPNDSYHVQGLPWPPVLGPISATPPTPTNLSATATDTNHIQLTWTDNSNAQAQFHLSDAGNLNADVLAGATSYTFSGVQPGSYHCFHLQAFSNSGSSSWTDWACITTPSQSSPSSGTSPSTGGNATADPLRLSLRADTTQLAVGNAATLTATTNRDIGPTPYYINIYDRTVSTTTPVARCGKGTTCSYSVRSQDPTTHSFIARLADNSGNQVAQTDSIAITWSGIQAPVPAPPPGGLWNSPVDGAAITIGSRPRFEARAYPTNQGGPAISHVAFTLWWPALGPESAWHVACDEYRASSPGVYGCDWSGSAQVPVGPTKISFNVYDVAGGRKLAPNGVHTLYFQSTAAPPTAPNSPALFNPGNGATLYAGSDITFSWNGMSNTTAYYLEYAGGRYGTLNSGWVNSTSYHVGQMWPGNTYTWRVKARNSGGEGDWSPTWSFAVSNSDPPYDAPGCLGAPSLQSPGQGDTINSGTQVTFRWAPPPNCSPGGYTFRITSSSNPNEQPWIVDTGEGSTSHMFTFNSNGTYYWSVRACKPCTPFAPGAWSTRILIISSASDQPQNPGGGVQLCENANYGGTCHTFAVGEYSNLSQYGLDNNASSLRDPDSAYHVTLYDQPGLTGTPGYFDNDTPQLPGYWNNRARSIRVERH